MRFPKIDLHTHILPENWPDLQEKYGYGGFVRLEHHQSCRARMMIDDRFFREIESNCWDPRVRLDDCSRHGVDMQVLSTVPVMFGYWAEPRDTLDLARFLNDHIAEVVAAHPTRFIGLGTLPMQAPDLAAAELERCVKDLGFPGVQIGTHVESWNLDAPELFPIFQRAADIGAAVFVHPWDMVGKDVMPDYFLPWLVGMPAETSLAMCSVIFGGVLDRLPSLRIAFAHGGGSFPGTLARIEKGHAARPDLCAVHGASNPRTYVDRMYVDSLVHDAPSLRFLLRLFGARRIALGSDYPFPLGESNPGQLIESMQDLGDDERRRMLSGTTLEFLDIKDPWKTD